MARVNFNFAQYDKEIINASLDRVEAAAIVIRDKARVILSGKLKGNWKEHGVYKRYWRKGNPKGEWIPYTGSSWTAREKGAMVKTIRVVRKPGKNNVWVMAGNYNTWWAVQLEYGRGAWRGGAKSFIRPALAGSKDEIRVALEGGAIDSSEYAEKAELGL